MHVCEYTHVFMCGGLQGTEHARVSEDTLGSLILSGTDLASQLATKAREARFGSEGFKGFRAFSLVFQGLGGKVPQGLMRVHSELIRFVYKVLSGLDGIPAFKEWTSKHAKFLPYSSTPSPRYPTSQLRG